MSLAGSRKALTEHYILRSIGGGIAHLTNDRMTLVYFSYLVFVVSLAVLAPTITPYEYDAYIRGDDGGLLKSQPPSLSHPLGTNDNGQDVFSRLVYGARPTVVTGLLAGLLIISIGASIGITAGYVGGRVEDFLMRITDLAFGVPLIPTAIVLLSILGFGFFASIFVIGLLLWRGNARVLRSQVLQIKQSPFIKWAEATGASRTRIIVKHILPQVAPMAVLFFALGVGYSVLIQASLAFLGVTSPFVPSWGIMVRNAYNSGLMAQLWWWSIPPGLFLSMTVLSTFMIGRKFEEIAGVEGSIAKGG